jgi:thymidylate synthase (FAD)
MKHRHWSPFEMVNVCLEIETTRDIARQILRHRSFTFQEFSQRYADPVKELTFEIREPRLQDQKNRQNSIEVSDAKLEDEWSNKQIGLIEMAKMTYNWAIDNGIAKEVARAVLPEGLTMSRMYVNGTLRSWLHYIEIRADVSTQKEHREIAIACAEVISQLFPMVTELIDAEEDRG